jgi:L-threonylcarbamoyladenylate synthase
MPYSNLVALPGLITLGDFLLSFPTDTVPALACLPDRADLLYAAKQRDPDKPLILLAGDIEPLWDYLAGSPADREVWRSVMAAYFPGALTLVLPASAQMPAAMNPGLSSGEMRTIGVRVPDHALARQILRQTGPLASTSANRSGQPALLEMGAIAQEFPTAFVLNDSTTSRATAGMPSTVAKWTGTGWQILRQGSVILPDAWLEAEHRSIQSSIQ